MSTTTNPTTELSATASGHEAHRRSTSYAADKAKILMRLRRMEGQVRGVQKMVEEDQYCLDILTQLSAVIAAARTTGLLVLEDHIRGCVLNAADEDRESALAELSEAIERFTRTVG
ncbi:MAG TPA: metal-sensitive transcriptional regulator [Thermomicrobiales bacterium]|jgi:DNA-binding FrmR family transcriptional regulator